MNNHITYYAIHKITQITHQEQTWAKLYLNHHIENPNAHIAIYNPHTDTIHWQDQEWNIHAVQTLLHHCIITPKEQDKHPPTKQPQTTTDHMNHQLQQFQLHVAIRLINRKEQEEKTEQKKANQKRTEQIRQNRTRGREKEEQEE
jgi:hypothetical protein